jgi:hypothetical protein
LASCLLGYWHRVVWDIGIGIFGDIGIVSWGLQEGSGRPPRDSRGKGKSPAAAGRLQEDMRHPAQRKVLIYIIETTIFAKCINNSYLFKDSP